MTRTRILSGWVLLLLAAVFLQPAPSAAQHPNIVYLISDNQRPDTIGALGNPHIRTPNLDRLVNSGFAFRNAYCMGSTTGAVCLPSRTMLMTGRTLFRIPIDQVSEEEEAAKGVGDIPNLPKLLKETGYNTLRTGKWGNYPRFAANEFHTNIVVARSLNGSERHADNAIEFLRKQTPAKPFFLYVAFAAPNDPRIAPAPYMDMYEPGDVPLPPNFLPMHPFDNGEMIVRDELLAPWPRTEKETLRHLADYYSVISYMDHEIGRILQALKENGQYENTIIVFSSDHGLAIGSHGLMGMQNLYEHSMRTSLVFSGPGVPAGKSSDALVYLFDVFPTLCDLTGIQIPDGVDGKTLVGILTGKAKGVRDSLFTVYKDVQRAVRDDRWKLIRYPKIDKTQLFDLRSDPHEMKNLADDPSHEAKVDSLMGLLRKWQRWVGDHVPLG